MTVCLAFVLWHSANGVSEKGNLSGDKVNGGDIRLKGHCGRGTVVVHGSQGTLRGRDVSPVSIYAVFI